MKIPRSPTACSLAFGLLVIACSERPTVITPLSSLTEMASPAADGSGEPNLNAAPDGRVILSWIEPADTVTTLLRFASASGERWSTPATIASGDDWFVNWADFPTVTVTEDGTMFAHYLQRSGEDTYAYDVMVTISRDGGATWGAPVKPHRDETRTEHGFVSMVPWTQDGVLIVWLDGRKTAGEGGGHEMTLRAAHMDATGRLSAEAELDGRTCDCCQTAAVRTADGAIVAYRDRSAEEVRDIAYVRFDGRAWSPPRTLHADGWHIEGCPVNGPALDNDGDRVVIGWFTMAQESPRVFVTMSTDAGVNFGEPIRIDDGDPLGRVDVVQLPNGGVLVTWLEAAGESAHVQARLVAPSGEPGLSVKLSDSDRSRGSGFPQAIRSGDRVYFAWTRSGDPSRVESSLLSLAGTGVMR